MDYNAFISYSHAVDGNLAPALHSALHKFAKPWYRMRALKIFRDKTSLPINPALWSSIASALDQAEYFILLASPKAASSTWVKREIEYWLQQSTPDRVLIVLTEGTLIWDPNSHGFDQDRSDALPQILIRAFVEEPLYLDLRWARTKIHLSLQQPRFREAVAELAATLHGRFKEELVGEDVRQHRRTQILAWSAIATLTILTLSSITAAYLALQQRNIAEVQRAQAVQQSRIALARLLAAQSTSILTQFPDQLPLAVLLGVESTQLYSSFEGHKALRAGLTLLPRTVQSYAYEDVGGRGRIRALAFSPDGKYLAVARDEGTVDLFDTHEGKALGTIYADENPVAVVNLTGEGFVGEASEGRTEMTSLAFSSDGLRFITGSNDKTARVWETESGRELLRVIHGGGVASVAFGPAGKYLATGSKNGNARVLDIDTGHQVMEFKHEEEVREVMFSPDGRYLAAISTDGGIGLSNLDTKEVRQARWYAGISGLGLAFSEDGKKLATANGNFAFIWEVESGKELLKVMHANSPNEALDHLVGWVDDVAFSPDGKYVATGGRDGTARLWNLETGQEEVRLQHGAGVNAVAFSPDGTTLSTTSFDGTARLWEIPSGREQLRAVHPGGSEVAVFSPDGSHVASGGVDGAINIWDLTRGDREVRIRHSADVLKVGFSPNGNTLVTVDDKGGLRLWSTRGELKAALQQPVWGPKRLVFSEDGRYLLVAARNPGLILIDVNNNLAVTRLPSFRNAGDPALSPRHLAAWDREHGLLRIWETAGGRELPPVEANRLGDLAFDSTGSFLAIMQREDDHGNGVIRVWALPELNEIGPRVTARSHWAFALNPRGRYLAVEFSEPGKTKYTVNRYVDVWDVATSARVTRIPQDKEVALLAFDSSGQLLVTLGVHFGDVDRELAVWDLPAGTLKVRLSHGKSINAIRFSNEDNILASISSGSVYVWDFSSSKLLSQLRDAGYIRDVRFSPDGRYLLVGSADNMAILWKWKTGDLRDEACQRLARNLLPNEWERYMGVRPYRKTCPNLQGND